MKVNDDKKIDPIDISINLPYDKIFRFYEGSNYKKFDLATAGNHNLPHLQLLKNQDYISDKIEELEGQINERFESLTHWFGSEIGRLEELIKELREYLDSGKYLDKIIQDGNNNVNTGADGTYYTFHRCKISKLKVTNPSVIDLNKVMFWSSIIIQGKITGVGKLTLTPQLNKMYIDAVYNPPGEITDDTMNPPTEFYNDNGNELTIKHVYIKDNDFDTSKIKIESTGLTSIDLEVIWCEVVI